MAAFPGVKYDDQGDDARILRLYPTNCFPLRTFDRYKNDVSGAWLCAYRKEQSRRFKAVLCAKPKTYTQIKLERIQKENGGKKPADETDKKLSTSTVLDGFYLLKHCSVDDPSDLCVINISTQELDEAREDDFILFDHVVYVNAGENNLPMEIFRRFPKIQELEMPLNQLHSIKLSPGDFPYLKVLDLSYNKLSEHDVTALGFLSALHVLHLSGNNLNDLSPEMVEPYQNPDSEIKYVRFPRLNVLMLDNNNLSNPEIFSILGNLTKLTHLDLEKNKIYLVPRLKNKGGKIVRVNSINVIDTHDCGSDDDDDNDGDETAGRNIGGELRKEDSSSGEDVEPVSEQETLAENTEGKKSASRESNLMEGFESLGNITARLEEINTNCVSVVPQRDKVIEKEPLVLPAHAPSLVMHAPKPSRLPFPELKFLNLAHNKIRNENALLAVVTWPALLELCIYDNPMTMNRSGDPPLLKRYLHDQLGVSIVRKPPGLQRKPQPDIRQKPRKIHSKVPKIPKINVHEMLMLQGPDNTPAITDAPSLQQHLLDAKEATGLSQQNSPAPEDGDTMQQLVAEKTPDITKKIKIVNEEDKDNGNLAFFMTQLDDLVEDQDTKNCVADSGHDKEVKEIDPVDERYKGYGLLLDVDESDPLPTRDLQSNVCALRYTLAHQRVFCDSYKSHGSVGKFYQPPPKPSKQQTMKQPRMKPDTDVTKTLEKLRDVSHIQEMNLADALFDHKTCKNKFKDVEKLYKKIQGQCEIARSQLMRPKMPKVLNTSKPE